MASGPGAWGAPRAVRLAVALVLTLVTGLFAATLVVAAVRGGPTTDAALFFYTGVLVLVLGALTVVAWRWVARSRHERGVAVATPTADGEPRPHRSLDGEIEPPQRW